MGETTRTYACLKLMRSSFLQARRVRSKKSAHSLFVLLWAQVG